MNCMEAFYTRILQKMCEHVQLGMPVCCEKMSADISMLWLIISA